MTGLSGISVSTAAIFHAWWMGSTTANWAWFHSHRSRGPSRRTSRHSGRRRECGHARSSRRRVPLARHRRNLEHHRSNQRTTRSGVLTGLCHSKPATLIAHLVSVSDRKRQLASVRHLRSGMASAGLPICELRDHALVSFAARSEVDAGTATSGSVRGSSAIATGEMSGSGTNFSRPSAGSFGLVVTLKSTKIA